MMEPTNTTILKDPAREAESMVDVTSIHGPDMEQVGEQVMSASTTQTSSTAWAKPRKARKRISDRTAESTITVHGARTDGKGTSQTSSISPAASINFEEDPIKYRRSMSAVYRMQETLRQKQIKYKEERESRRANIDSLYEYVFGILAHRLDLEYTTVVELVLDAPSFQDFDDFFSVGGRRSLIFFYQEAEVPGIECGRIIPGAIKKGKMMRLFLGNIDDIFKGLCLVFIRCNNHIVITKKNVHEELHFSVLDATEGLFTGIRDLLSKAFLPVIKATDNWGHLYQSKHVEREKQQFVEAIDQYLSHLLGVKLTIEEGVKLKNIESINFAAMQSFEGIRAAAADEAVVARCEEALVVWYSQIHQVLLENEQVRREADDSGPMTELEHWIRNYMKFNFIIEQVKGENVKAVVVVLTMAKSKLIKMWKELDLTITNATNESKDNVSILDVLEQACQPLYTLDMASMVRGIPKLLNAIQTIYNVSTYYQTSEHITSLFMKVTNQIVTACKAYITDKGKLNIWDQDVETVMLKIKECTFLIQEYQECLYRKQTYCEMQNEKPFDVSEIYIFGKLKAFCQRTDKITEILSVVQTYSALSQSKIEGMDCLDLKFKHIYQNFKKRTFNILNMKKTEFDADLTEFLGQILNFEEQIQDFMSNSIGRIRSPQEAAQLLQRFQKLNIPCLKSEIPKIIKCILQHYMEMLQATITVYECYKEDPPISKSMPPVAGRILWSRHLFSRMHVPITYLKNNSDILSGTEGEAAVRLYNSIACVLVKYEVLLHRIWCNDVPSELRDALQANLLVHHPETKQMMVNFDNKILQILQETKYMMKMGLDVPEEAEDFLKIDAKLKSNHLQLEKLLKTHETICGQILPVFTKVLSGKINKVESTFSKGLSKLTWSSFALKRYFEDLDTNIQIFGHLINQVNDIQRISIDAALKDIAETLLIKLPEDGPTSIENILASNEIYTKKMTKYLNHRSEQIEQAVEKIVQIFKTVREPKSATSMKTRSKKKETRRVAFTDTDKYEEALEEQAKDEEFNKQCSEVYSYFTGRLVDSLQQCTCFSLDYLKRKLFVSSAFDYRDFLSLPVRRDDPAPFLIAQVHLVMDNIVVLPSLDNIQQAIHHLVETTLGVSRGVYQWEKWKVPEVASVQEFSGSPDIVSGQQKKAEEEMKEEERPKRNFYSSVIQGTTIPKLDVLVSTSVNSLREKVSDALRGFEKYRTLWTENREIKVKEYVTENQSLDEIKERISYYYMLEQDVSEIDSALRVGFIELNTVPIKKSITAEANAWKLLLCKSLNEEYKMKMVEMSEFITVYMKILSRPILDLDDVRCVMEALTIIRANEIRMDSSVGPAEEAYAILSRFQFDFTREEYDVIDTLRYSFSKLISKAASVQDELIRIQPELKRKLLESVEILQNDMVAFDNDYEKEGPLVPGITCKEANARLQIFQMRFDDLWRKCVTCSSGEQLFGLPVSDWDILHKRRKELELLQKLYILYDILMNSISGYYETMWIDINIKKLYAELQDFQKKCDNLPEGLKHWQAFQDLKKTMDDFSESCPLLEMMTNDAMKKRHWDHIANLVGRRLNVQSDSFCLGDIMEAPILQHKDEIEDICVSAVKEKEIESKLAQVSNVWNKQVLKFSNLKGRGEVLIEGAEAAEIIVTIEDSLMVLGLLLNNRYNEHFKKTIQDWIQQLSTSSAMLEEWLQVQTLWIYLEAVFFSGDIASQLPEEAKRFKNIDKTWMKLMQQAHDRARVSQCCVGDEALIHILPYLHEQLQICQKSLSGCLEQKRLIFPRFFFVSDTVLLEILGQASDSHYIQPHLAALSANINEVEFSATHYDRILSVVSREGEVIKLDCPVQARGPIELWLGELLLMQQNSLHGVIRSAYGQITDGGCQLVNFLNNFPTQVGLLALQMLWTHDSEEALCTMKEHGKVLQSTRQKFNEILIELIGQTVRDLTEHDRIKYETLITIHINQRDVFDDLVKMHIRSANDFEWLKQSRVYFKEWVDKVLVSITDVDFVYQNEFLGCTERLVITQLTDRCYISLAQAIGMNMGGAPTGPAATGKTETVKDMGKALGKYVMVFNCSDQMDFRGLGRIFKGLAQSGSWGCLDALNCVELPVLSVAAQQIYIVLSAQKGRREQFHFSDGVIVNLNPEFGIFLTVNPVYIGRQELPENLKIQFRTVSMMVPDRKTIIRIKLASSGFVDFVSLSQKFYALYKLCEEQLSRQVHYDFGLRNILSVLRTIKALKRERPDASESSIVTRGLRDMNVSKLVGDDEPLFQSLIDDLFPGIQLDTNSYTELQNAVSNQVRLSGLVNHPHWNLKLIQLYETAQVRHGLMTLGPSGSGKTSLTHLLMKALTACGLPHREVRMNPKAITVPQLFGRLDTASNDWTDGIFSTLLRKMLKSKKGENVWIVLDGPVDSIWIENLNSVLDDNKTLTLANGDRIPMAPCCKLLFEVDSIENASPSAVSRMGMVFLSSSVLSWRIILKAWLNKRSAEEREIFQTLYDKVFEDVYTYVHRNLHPKMQLLECNYIMQSISLLEGCIPTKDECAAPDLGHLHRLFVFALMWSLGALLELESRDRLEAFLKNHKGKLDLPEGDAGARQPMFEFVVNENGEWEHWSKRVSQYSYPMDYVPDYKSILVPNIDSVRTQFLIDTIAKQQKAVLLIGETGTGKTVMIKSYMSRYNPEEHVSKSLNFSSATEPGMFQRAIESFVEKRIGSTYGPLGGRKMTVFIDDINMPAVNDCGDQITNEIVRQMMEMKGMYSLVKPGDFMTIADVQIIGAMIHPGGGRNDIPQRLKRHFTIFNCTSPSNASIDQIFGVIGCGYYHSCRNFKAEVCDLVKKLVPASRALWQMTKVKMLPTPSKSHYIFNLRDLSRIWQGMISITAEKCATVSRLLALYKHECQRVIADRFVCSEDRDWFDKSLAQVIAEHVDARSVSEVKNDFYFVDFLREDPEPAGEEPEELVLKSPKLYQMVLSFDVLSEQLKLYQTQLNDVQGSSMDLVFFKDAVIHLIKISRIIRTDYGNALLVGVGGSGKRSLSQLASFIAGYKVFQIVLTRSYGTSNLLEDLKLLYKTAGVEGKGITFIFTDHDIREETFLEYISYILSSGEVSGLFSREELEEITQSLLPVMKAEFPRQPPTFDNLYEYFVSRCRKNLHIILCFSPVGARFRIWSQKFPALLSGCTMDWFRLWPREALVAISSHFLSGLDFAFSSEVKSHVMEAMGVFHEKMSESCQSFFHRFRRRVYITQKSYLSFIHSYKSVYAEKCNNINEQTERMNRGLSKLIEANESIRNLSMELEAKEKNLALASVKAEKVLEELTLTVQEAAKIKIQVQLVKEKAQRLVEKIENDNHRVEKILEGVRPTLEEAEAALNRIKLTDISAVRKRAKPPHLTMRIMDSLLLFLQKKLDPVVIDPEKRCCKPSWGEALKLMSKSEFLLSLKKFRKDSINEEMVELLQPYFQMEDYTMENAGKVCGNVAGLLSWTLAMAKFYEVNKEVLPLKAYLIKQDHHLQATNCELSAVQLHLDEKEAELNKAQAKYDGAMLEKMNLLSEVEIFRKKIEAASALIDGLSEEKIRWTEQSEVFKTHLNRLAGDVLLASAFLSYCGPFNETFRNLFLKDIWVKEIRSRNIPLSENLSAVSMLADQLTVSEWILQGLPGDDLSIQNGIIITKAARYPLLIDPQSQGKTWIKNKEKNNELQVTSLNHKCFHTHLEACLSVGRPLLIEDIGEELDPSLDNVLEKHFFKSGSSLKVKVGDKEFDVVDKFRLYITTKLPNPVFTPEINAKTLLIDFTVTIKGLENQLLDRVLFSEKPELEAERIKLMKQVNVNKRKLQELEDSLLYRLSATTGYLVEDKSLMEILRITKQRVGEWKGKLHAAAADKEAKIMETREEYHLAATRGSLLYTLMTEMNAVNVMYNVSLRQFFKLFDRSTARSDRSPHSLKRIRNITEYLTHEVFSYYSRGLYERHKFLFVLLLTLRVDLQRGYVKHKEFRALLQGGAALDLKACPPKPYKWILDMTWRNLVELSKLSQFSEIMTQVTRNEKAWKNWMERDFPEEEIIPDGYNNSLNSFHRLLLIRSCCPDRTLPQARKYIRDSLNAKYIEPNVLNLTSTWEESDPRTPLLCLLSRGYDPTNHIDALARKMKLECRAVSMGQGQGVLARRLLHMSMQQGGWILLQNCHLDLDFMVELLETIESSAAVHETFRVWMSTEPHKQFPITLLQASIRFTHEPPQGLRAGLKRTFSAISRDVLDASSSPMWKPLLYTVAFLHSAVQERRKYGPLGWNIPYDFNSADFTASVQFIQNHLDECGIRKSLSWSAVRYMIGEVQYGGRITQHYDKLLLNCFTKVWFSDKIFDPTFCFYIGYKIPQCETVEQYINYIQSLPAVNSPQVLGLHSNADITYKSKAAADILNTITNIQPKESHEDMGDTLEAVVYGIAEDMLERLPLDYISHEVTTQLQRTGALNPMNTFLRQEIDRMQKVISIVRSDLSDLKLAIDGKMIMNETFRDILDAMYDARIPRVWSKVSWTSSTLGLWFGELLERSRQLTSWIYEGRPNVFWMTGFFNPQGFLTAIIQEAVGAHKGWALESMTVKNVILRQMKEEITAPPSDGVYIHGLFLEGAGWDRRNSKLVECTPRVLFAVLPVVHIFADNLPPITDPSVYKCPVYKKPERTDLNYVTSISMKTSLPPDYWILRGVAALCDIK